MKRIRERWQERTKQGIFSPGGMISLALCFMLFGFAPMEIYLNNPADFWYDAWFLLPWCLGWFAAAFAGEIHPVQMRGLIKNLRLRRI